MTATRRFQIVLAKPEGFWHIEALREVIEAMQAGFVELGIEVPVVENRLLADARPILFGAQHVGDGEEALFPDATILYNTEQLTSGYPWVGERLLRLLARFEVWDLNSRNIALLQQMQRTTRVQYVPVGYAPLLTRIDPAQEDIDVLFVGRISERRAAVLREIAQSGLAVHAINNSYGVERDRAIARASLVVNIHLADGGAFESPRAVYLLANRKAVVCESEAPDDIEEDLREGMVAARYRELAATCIALARDAGERRRIAEAGFRAVSAPGRRYSSILRKALSATAA